MGSSSRRRGDIQSWRALTGATHAAAIHALNTTGPLPRILGPLAASVVMVDAFTARYPDRADEERAREAAVLSTRFGTHADTVLQLAYARGGGHTIRLWDGYRPYASLTGGLVACQPGRTVGAPPWAEPIPSRDPTGRWRRWPDPNHSCGVATPAGAAAVRRRRAEIAAGRAALGRTVSAAHPTTVPAAAPQPLPPGTDADALGVITASLEHVRTGLRHLHLEDLAAALDWHARHWGLLARNLRRRADGGVDVGWIARPDYGPVVCFISGRAVDHARFGGAWSTELPEAVMFWGDPARDGWRGATEAATAALQVRRREILLGSEIMAARGVPAVAAAVAEFAAHQADQAHTA